MKHSLPATQTFPVTAIYLPTVFVRHNKLPDFKSRSHSENDINLTSQSPGQFSTVNPKPDITKSKDLFLSIKTEHSYSYFPPVAFILNCVYIRAT